MSSNEHRRNEQIQSPKIRLIDPDGEMKGVVARTEALRLAEEAELDLVEIQPNVDPPVCRIMDYGKFRYEQQKKEAKARKHQKQIEIKEVQFRPLIDQHDYEIKLNHVRDFLNDGNKVRLVIRFKGWERNSRDLAQVLYDRMVKDLGNDAQLEVKGNGRDEGNQMLLMAAPLSKTAKLNKAAESKDVKDADGAPKKTAP